MKKKSSRVTFTPGVPLVCYPMVILAALMLAQGIKSPITNMIFWFVLILPCAVPIELVLMKLCLRASMNISDTVTVKKEPLCVSLNLENKGFLPIVHAEVRLACVGINGRVHTAKKLLLPLLPFSSYSHKESIDFSYKGKYSIETDCIVVCDLFRMVWMGIPFENLVPVTVLPRRIAMPDEQFIGRTGDVLCAANGRSDTDEEITDIRPYIKGDSPKRIHWKLSSKSEETVVRDSSCGDNTGVRVILDMRPPFEMGIPGYTASVKFRDDADFVCGDAVAEYAIAAAVRAVENGIQAAVGFMENGEPTVIQVRSSGDVDVLSERLSATTFDRSPDQIERISDAINSFGVPTVIISPVVDSDTVGSAVTLSDRSFTEFIVCAGGELCDDPSFWTREYDTCKARMERSGVRVVRADLELS